jgi:hypothetical protein
MTDREEHINEARKIFNHICLLNDTEVVRCIGFAEDDEDYYWIVLSPKRGLIYSSKVGSCESLKDIDYSRYEYLEMEMNDYWNCPRADNFEIIKR